MQTVQRLKQVHLHQVSLLSVVKFEVLEREQAVKEADILFFWPENLSLNLAVNGLKTEG